MHDSLDDEVRDADCWLLKCLLLWTSERRPGARCTTGAIEKGSESGCKMRQMLDDCRKGLEEPKQADVVESRGCDGGEAARAKLGAPMNVG